MKSRPRKAALIAGFVLIIAAVLFRMIAVPALVRFPSHLDKDLRYTGAYTSYVDEKTLLPLAQPKVEPFSLDRHLKIVKSDFDRVVIHEDLTFHEGARVLKTQNQYVMNRRSMAFEKSPDSWSFTPSNVVDRTGSYRVQFPMGVSTNGSYDVWNNETSKTVHITPVSGAHMHKESGVDVIDFTGSLYAPVTPAATAWLKSNGLPISVSPTQLQAQLSAQGIDVPAALAAVGPKLRPAESAVLSDALSNAVPLQYWFVYNGMVSIEPHTGAIMDVHSQVEGLDVKPDLSGVAKLQPLLQKYSPIPAVKAVGDGLAKLVAAPPQHAASFTFTETAASSLDVGKDAEHQITMMRLVEEWIPWGLAVLGIFLVAVGLIGRRRPGTPQPTAQPPETSQPEERTPISVP